MEKEPLSLLQFMSGNWYTQLMAVLITLAVLAAFGTFGSSIGERAAVAVATLAIAAAIFFFARRSYRKFYLPAANRRK